MICSGTVVLGSKVAIDANNYVIQADQTYSGAAIIGTALETGSASEVILVDVNIGGGVAG